MLLCGSIYRSILFVIPFVPIDSTTLSEFHCQFQFHVCHVHPAPLAYSITFLFRIFHICVCIITLPFVLTYEKLKEKLRPSPGIGGWNFATGDK